MSQKSHSDFKGSVKLYCTALLQKSAGEESHIKWEEKEEREPREQNETNPETGDMDITPR